MAASPKSATILEHCRVAPPADGEVAAPQALPLTFLDVPWVNFHPIHRLLFYQFPCSKSHFMETIVPCFNNSLSLTLKYFLPLAGNLILPLTAGKLELRYVAGDSVSVTAAESNEAHDFDYLTGNHPRVADEFYAFLPDMPPAKTEPEFKIIPILAVQITLFPGAGICVGITNSHVIGDASSTVRFLKAWSSVARLAGGDGFSPATQISLPLFDRSVVKDPSGLLNVYWDQIKQSKGEIPPTNFPTNKLRATYILHKNDIVRLWNSVKAKKPALTHLSSFTITAAYVWSCLAKSAAASGEEVDDREPEYFTLAADVRGRTDPPIPAAYFGNCVGLAVAESTHGELKGEDGFAIAVELIGEVIGKKVNNKDEILADAAEWMAKLKSLIGKRLLGVAGSPKFDAYDADFGWGKPSKYESVSIDRDGSMSLCKSRDFEGDLEIGLSLSKNKIEAFADFFTLGLLKIKLRGFV